MIYILYKSYFIIFYIKNKIIRINIFIFIELELKNIYFIIIIYNKYFKVINLINLKSIFIKDY
jgi:hypothetical protein